ncbi:MAG: hypothetical protein AB7E49_07450 [Campylobacterales bacterium]
MNTFKNHLSLIFALVTLLASFQFFVSFSSMVETYEKTLGSDYSVIVISKKPLQLQVLQRAIPYAVSLEPIDPAFIVDEVKGALSETNLAYLKTALPLFYRLKLDRFPSIDDRQNIEKRIGAIDSVLRVETFAKTQNKIYKLLLLNKTIILVFAALMFVVAVLLIVRQMEVWRYEHSDRMSIMSIFGAPVWLRSAVLYRLAFVDSLISVAIVGGLFYYLSADSGLSKALVEIGLPSVGYNMIIDTLKLFALSLFISVSSVMYVIIKAEEEA